MNRHRDRGDYSDDTVSNHHHQQDNNTSNSPGDHFHRRHHHPYPYNNNNQLHDSSAAPYWEDTHHSIPHSGHKRPFSHFTQDLDDAVSVVKLYVAGVPKTATEEDIRSVFGEHGNVVEVVLLKDKRTGQQQESCFVKYASFEEANVAIGTLNGLYPFSGILYPIKVKYADGERERLEKKGMLQNICSPTTVASASQKNYGHSGENTLKLYVGCVNRQASKEEIEEIFLPYGDVEDVFIVRDEMRQQRGCAFVRFSCREMAVAAINALHGVYVMRGCEQPLIVRFADPKKPRGADSRAAPCNRDRMGGHIWPNDFHQPADTGNKPHSESFLPSSSSSCAAVSTSADGSDYIDCDWSEHICPDGNPYYYNCVTCESRWEKPEEYTVYERELLKLEQQQQQQYISHPRVLSSIEGAA